MKRVIVAGIIVKIVKRCSSKYLARLVPMFTVTKVGPEALVAVNVIRCNCNNSRFLESMLLLLIVS